MKEMFRAVLTVVTMSIVPTALFSKGETIKITIKGPGLSVPIESTDAKVRDFQVWAGPGVRINDLEQTEGFIIDWAQGTVAQPATALSRYEVSFYVSGRVNGWSTWCPTHSIRKLDEASYIFLARVTSDIRGTWRACTTGTVWRGTGFALLVHGRAS